MGLITQTPDVEHRLCMEALALNKTMPREQWMDARYRLLELQTRASVRRKTVPAAKNQTQKLSPSGPRAAQQKALCKIFSQLFYDPAKQGDVLVDHLAEVVVVPMADNLRVREC